MSHGSRCVGPAANVTMPNVNIEIEGKGSATAPPALASGTAQFGPMSREMKADEADAFEKKFGYRLTSEDFVNGGLYNSTHNA